ncbi:hypothetical protein [Parasphingorhabdus sp.]
MARNTIALWVASCLPELGQKIVDVGFSSCLSIEGVVFPSVALVATT